MVACDDDEGVQVRQRVRPDLRPRPGVVSAKRYRFGESMHLNTPPTYKPTLLIHISISFSHLNASRSFFTTLPGCWVRRLRPGWCQKCDSRSQRCRNPCGTHQPIGKMIAIPVITHEAAAVAALRGPHGWRTHRGPQRQARSRGGRGLVLPQRGTACPSIPGCAC